MNIALIDRTTACCREVLRQTKIAQEQMECIVPDVYEDVGQIVSAQAQICLKSKDVMDRTVSIGAAAEISVLYITENRERVRCMSFSKNLEISFDSPEIGSDMSAQVSLCCMGVQARAVNPRKISAQLSVRAELSLWAEDRLCIPAEAAGTDEANGLQLRQGSIGCVPTVSVGEKSFVINEQLPLELPEPSVMTAPPEEGGGAESGPETAWTTAPESGTLSAAKIRLTYLDHQIIGSKVLLKGSAELSIVFEAGSARERPELIRQSLPLSVLIDMPDEACRLGRVRLEPTAVYADLGEAINGRGVMEIELHGVAQVCFEKEETLSYLADAYSTLCPVSLTRGTARLCRAHSREELRARGAERIAAERERGEIAACFAELLSYGVREGRAELSASAAILLRAEDGGFSAQQRLITMEAPLPDSCGEIGEAWIDSLRAERAGEEIVLEATAGFVWERCETAELSYLSAIEPDAENALDPASLPSLTIARRGDRDNWELAKKYHSSVEAIEQMEQLYPMGEELVLIPRLPSK